ncbi:MAG TPA: hypothetical protein VIV60_29370, partial [Polyangiaceae bacterium]
TDAHDIEERLAYHSSLQNGPLKPKNEVARASRMGDGSAKGSRGRLALHLSALCASFLVLLDGSWVRVSYAARAGSRELRYLLEQDPEWPMLCVRDRILSVAVLIALWLLCAVASRKVRRIVPVWATWIATLGVGAAQVRQWRAFTLDYERNVQVVFDEARHAPPRFAWVGVYGIGDQMGFHTAIAPDGRVARVDWTCSGMTHVAWGRSEQVGTFLRFHYDYGGAAFASATPALYRVVDCSSGQRELMSVAELKAELSGNRTSNCTLTDASINELRLELERLM